MKKQMVDAIATGLKLTRQEALLFLDAFYDTIAERLEKGDSVHLTGFGSFAPHRRKARIARNPATGEDVFVGPKITPFFKPARKFVTRITDGKKKKK